MAEETAIVAGGCFWCTEAVFRDVIGVDQVESGYIGGTVPDPTYKAVCSGTTGHAEAIRVTYDPAAISYAEILDVFMGTHDPTQLNRQGNDVGTQYRSAIFPQTPEQRETAERVIARVDASGKWPRPVTTTVEPAAKWYSAEAEAAIERWNVEHGGGAVTTIEGPAQWYPAENYHQEYWEGEGQRNPYCLATIPPKLLKLRKSFQAKVKST